MNTLKIDPELYYFEDALRIQGLDGAALKAARDSGELRFRQVGKQIVYKGSWLCEWLDKGKEAQP
jgi:hypothetical protein